MGGQARQKPSDMLKERSAGMFSPGGSPCIRVLSVWTTVAVATVDGSSSRTPATSLTVAAYIRARDRASESMFAPGNSAARQAREVKYPDV